VRYELRTSADCAFAYIHIALCLAAIPSTSQLSFPSLSTSEFPGGSSSDLLGLEAVNCQTGDLLASEQVQAENKEAVLRALGKAAASLRQKLGESLSSVQRYDTPVEEATTSSLEALKSFSSAYQNANHGKQLEAIPQYQRAFELDPNFASAFSGLGAIYANLGEADRAMEYAQNGCRWRCCNHRHVVWL